MRIDVGFPFFDLPPLPSPPPEPPFSNKQRELGAIIIIHIMLCLFNMIILSFQKNHEPTTNSFPAFMLPPYILSTRNMSSYQYRHENDANGGNDLSQLILYIKLNLLYMHAHNKTVWKHYGVKWTDITEITNITEITKNVLYWFS